MHYDTEGDAPSEPVEDGDPRVKSLPPVGLCVSPRRPQRRRRRRGVDESAPRFSQHFHVLLRLTAPDCPLPDS